MSRAVTFAGLLLTGSLLQAQGADTSAWEDNYDKAKAAAKRAGRPMFLVFR